MNRTEVTLLLAKVQSNDRRTVGEIDVLTWLEALDDIDAPLAMEAVRDHIKRGDGWLTPKMVRDYVRAVHVQRMRDAGPPDYPSGLTQGQERAYRLLWLDAVKRGLPAAEATAASDEELGYQRGQLNPPTPDARKVIEDFKLKDPNDPRNKKPKDRPEDAA